MSTTLGINISFKGIVLLEFAYESTRYLVSTSYFVCRSKLAYLTNKYPFLFQNVLTNMLLLAAILKLTPIKFMYGAYMTNQSTYGAVKQ